MRNGNKCLVLLTELITKDNLATVTSALESLYGASIDKIKNLNNTINQNKQNKCMKVVDFGAF